MAIKLDDENERWLTSVRKQQLKNRGWKGTVAEWLAVFRKLGEDPLNRKPPMTRPPKQDGDE